MKEAEYTTQFCFDIEAILDYYVSIKDEPSTANSFFDQLQKQMVQIRTENPTSPMTFQKISFRRKIITGFPYAIYFEVLPDDQIRFERILHRNTPEFS